MQADWAAAVAKRKRCGRGKSGLRRAVCRITSGTWASKPRDGQCHRKQTARTPRGVRVRVKRCGKSAPLRRQRRRHGKPHTEQDQIGNESGSNAGTRRPGAAAPKGRPGKPPRRAKLAGVRFTGRKFRVGRYTRAPQQCVAQRNGRPRQNPAYRSACCHGPGFPMRRAGAFKFSARFTPRPRGSVQTSKRRCCRSALTSPPPAWARPQTGSRQNPA
jgi:hypothetical protein